MNTIPNRQVICEELMAQAKQDKNIVVLCSDSRGSASMTPFFEKYPEQSVEVGIAEQNLVGVAAGMSHAGKKTFCFSPACFISTRAYEQAKVDVAYSNTNVKLIGISGGISYGELGMSHHSAQDIAAMTAIPNMRVYLPSDRHQTAKLIDALLQDDKPAYVRVGRNPVEDIYEAENTPFRMDKAVVTSFGTEGVKKVVIVACGEMVEPSIEAAKILEKEQYVVTVMDMFCIKPFDRKSLLEVSKDADLVLSVEEHSPFGGLGSIVASELASTISVKVVQKALPDDHVITGKSKAVFDYYGLNAEGIAKTVRENI